METRPKTERWNDDTAYPFVDEAGVVWLDKYGYSINPSTCISCGDTTARHDIKLAQPFCNTTGCAIRMDGMLGLVGLSPWVTAREAG